MNMRQLACSTDLLILRQTHPLLLNIILSTTGPLQLRRFPSLVQNSKCDFLVLRLDSIGPISLVLCLLDGLLHHCHIPLIVDKAGFHYVARVRQVSVVRKFLFFW